MEPISKKAVVERIQKVLDELNLKSGDVSEKAGRNREWWTQLCRDKDRWPSFEYFFAFCEAMGIRLDYAMSGRQPKFIDENSPVHIPVLSGKDFEDNALAYVEIGNFEKGDFVALSMPDDSMDRIAPRGATIIVDRQKKTLLEGNYYIFHKPYSGEYVFRQWAKYPERLKPCSTLSHYDSIFLSSSAEVVGGLVQIIYAPRQMLEHPDT